jgi:hypothetical protein
MGEESGFVDDVAGNPEKEDGGMGDRVGCAIGGVEILKFVNVELNEVVDVGALGRDCWTGGPLNIAGTRFVGAAVVVVLAL